MPTQLPDDDELMLIRHSGVVLRAGLMALPAGTGSYRAKETMVHCSVPGWDKSSAGYLDRISVWEF